MVDVKVDKSSLPAGTYNTELRLTITYNPIRVGSHPTTVLVPVTLTVP
jgi:hypothetical protein